MSGNVFLNGSVPCIHEDNPLVFSDFDPCIKLIEELDGYYLEMKISLDIFDRERVLVTTELLGNARTPDLPYVQNDSQPYRIDMDYFGRARNTGDPSPGPFVLPVTEKLRWRVWPVEYQDRSCVFFRLVTG